MTGWRKCRSLGLDAGFGHLPGHRVIGGHVEKEGVISEPDSVDATETQAFDTIDVLFPLVGWLIEGFVYPFNNR